MTGAHAIVLLRHGATIGAAGFLGRTDAALSAAGWAQMQAGGAGLWERIVSSPLARCRVFATDCARRHRLPLQVDARWAEMHFGAWEGRTAAELMASDPQALARFWRDPLQHAPPGAEPLSRVQTRVLAAFTELRASSGPVLVVTHGGPIRIVLCHVHGRPLERLLDWSVAHGSAHRFVMDDAGGVCAEAQPA